MSLVALRICTVRQNGLSSVLKHYPKRWEVLICTYYGSSFTEGKGAIQGGVYG